MTRSVLRWPCGAVAWSIIACSCAGVVYTQDPRRAELGQAPHHPEAGELQDVRGADRRIRLPTINDGGRRDALQFCEPLPTPQGPGPLCPLPQARRARVYPLPTAPRARPRRCPLPRAASQGAGEVFGMPRGCRPRQVDVSDSPRGVPRQRRQAAH